MNARHGSESWATRCHRAAWNEGADWREPVPQRAPPETGYPRSWWAVVIVCAIAALVITLTGCGGGDEGEGETVYVNYHPEKKPTPPEALL